MGLGGITQRLPETDHSSLRSTSKELPLTETRLVGELAGEMEGGLDGRFAVVGTGQRNTLT